MLVFSRCIPSDVARAPKAPITSSSTVIAGATGGRVAFVPTASVFHTRVSACGPRELPPTAPVCPVFIGCPGCLIFVGYPGAEEVSFPDCPPFTARSVPSGLSAPGFTIVGGTHPSGAYSPYRGRGRSGLFAGVDSGAFVAACSGSFVRGGTEASSGVDIRLKPTCRLSRVGGLIRRHAQPLTFPRPCPRRAGRRVFCCQHRRQLSARRHSF